MTRRSPTSRSRRRPGRAARACTRRPATGRGRPRLRRCRARYPAPGAGGPPPDERQAAALDRYDNERRRELLATLECFLGARSSIAATARALFIHPNTLRQRLDRVAELTGLDLATEDLLSLELAVKRHRLAPASGDRA